MKDQKAALSTRKTFDTFEVVGALALLCILAGFLAVPAPRCTAAGLPAPAAFAGMDCCAEGTPVPVASRNPASEIAGRSLGAGPATTATVF